jgi:hypothetical protein
MRHLLGAIARKMDPDLIDWAYFHGHERLAEFIGIITSHLWDWARMNH